MPTLLIRFPARRYHATPWGHHVNEGLIEWPPSPWRLLRALLSVGYTAGLWDGQGPPAVARSLIEKLAAVLPLYRLPSASGAHSRHYMPTDKLDKQGLPNRTMVFDTWAQVGDKDLSVTWDVELAGEEIHLLSKLAESMGYLGRSESWTDARLLQPDEPLPDEHECVPSDDPPPPGWEQVSLIAAQPSENYNQWRKDAVGERLVALTTDGDVRKKPTKKQREKAVEPYPADLIECLQKDTSWWHKHGWSQPPGSRRVFYRRRVTALEAGAPRPHQVKTTAPSVQVMLLSMTTQSRNNHALPPITRTLPQAELFHRALTSYATRDGKSCPLITGCDENKRPLKGPHDHAHVLPVDLDGDGHLDHVLVWAPAGFDGQGQNAIRAMRQTYAKGLVEPLQVALVGIGGIEDLRRLPGEYGERLRSVLGPEGGAQKWKSLTPFVAPRYLKNYGRNTFTGQVAAELVSRGLPFPVEIKIMEPGEHPASLQHRHFIRVRRRGPKPPADFGYSLELRFDTPVTGPLCLGYASHFGLGLFAAAEGE